MKQRKFFVYEKVSKCLFLIRKKQSYRKSLDKKGYKKSKCNTDGRGANRHSKGTRFCVVTLAETKSKKRNLTRGKPCKIKVFIGFFRFSKSLYGFAGTQTLCLENNTKRLLS